MNKLINKLGPYYLKFNQSNIVLFVYHLLSFFLAYNYNYANYSDCVMYNESINFIKYSTICTRLTFA